MADVFYFDKYVEQADRKAKASGKDRTPYVLKFREEDEPDIVIAYPDANQQLDYEEAQSANAQLRILLKPGDYVRLREKLIGQDAGVVKQIVRDIWSKWGDDGHDVPGGKADSGD